MMEHSPVDTDPPGSSSCLPHSLLTSLCLNQAIPFMKGSKWSSESTGATVTFITTAHSIHSEHGLFSSTPRVGTCSSMVMYEPCGQGACSMQKASSKINDASFWHTPTEHVKNATLRNLGIQPNEGVFSEEIPENTTLALGPCFGSQV